ncbi:endonuclease III domain-containing protein [Candidatus Poribacteria bacterium]|nr:endonuclease III domain-containing protein [Candidatus Poribacteria bacterium]MYA55434.1 endonuclease III domain-containing protein [Candidatus Poribacteria bacterium]
MQILCEGNITEKLFTLYNQLLAQHGNRKWWPADTPFEVALGAILTQATSWRNVEKAMDNLKDVGAFTPEEIASISQSALEQLIRPSRYFRMKAQKVRALVDHIADRPMHVMFTQDVPELREELLSIYGVGPETADTIILYAAGKPSFVVDSYTYRLFSRLGWVTGRYNYDKLRALFMDNLPHDVDLFNEYHALIVSHGARICHKKTPNCQECRLQTSCAYYRSSG